MFEGDWTPFIHIPFSSTQHKLLNMRNQLAKGSTNTNIEHCQKQTNNFHANKPIYCNFLIYLPSSYICCIAKSHVIKWIFALIRGGSDKGVNIFIKSLFLKILKDIKYWVELSTAWMARFCIFISSHWLS